MFEDGIRQELSLFTHENLPISLAVLIDTSASMQEKLPQARAAASRFVKTLRPQDDAQIVQFNDRSTVLQDFTNDQALLEAAIKKTDAAGPDRPLQLAVRGLEGPLEAEEDGRAAAPGRDRALGRRGHRLPRDRRAGDGAGAPERDRHLPDQPASQPQPGPGPHGLQPGRAHPDEPGPGDGRPGLLPAVALRARVRLRPHRRGAAHAVQPRLRVVERPARRQMAAHRGANARARRPCRSVTSSATTPRRADAQNRR